MHSRKAIVALAFAAAATAANAAWYWPFGGSGKDEPRLSELMRPASDLIDRASDLAEEGKIDEAVAEYRKALAELARTELENPDRVDKPEFATLRNKRAYVIAAIDSLLFMQARENTRPVTLTDTSNLEERFKKMKEEEEAFRKGQQTEEAKESAEKRKARLREAMDFLGKKDYLKAQDIVKAVLAERPNDAAALNLKARIESETGDSAAAEMTLSQCITSNPKDSSAYYNLAKLILKTRGHKGKASAKRYYERSCACGGARDAAFEEELK